MPFFENATNVTIHNGQFTNVNGDAVVFNHMGTHRGPGQASAGILEMEAAANSLASSFGLDGRMKPEMHGLVHRLKLDRKSR
ncbi:hypothetical protein CC1G_12111 [Coprinopsis cinerea okayama7|uniref:Uncharacterized protein n=1 Tax=Coprinopsis cinerea (strain Okayama-7 / 130 / ATCC MYA-4618 / FGSC 9003) TaxID=240176 RepID=A8PHB2_COPC7|nr:hypothetical protein CC1G_12111 [Coprinopsis cinerea okayama7\|eukprot:XP_001841376.1 hypothetical protein CC1G_12111 [Coprinopsis cinerea okayama7\